MSKTHIDTTITLGDEPPEVRTYTLDRSFATIEFGDVEIVVHGEEQAYALIEALGEAMAFFQDAEPAKAAS